MWNFIRPYLPSILFLGSIHTLVTVVVLVLFKHIFLVPFYSGLIATNPHIEIYEFVMFMVGMLSILLPYTIGVWWIKGWLGIQNVATYWTASVLGTYFGMFITTRLLQDVVEII